MKEMNTAVMNSKQQREEKRRLAKITAQQTVETTTKIEPTTVASHLDTDNVVTEGVVVVTQPTVDTTSKVEEDTGNVYRTEAEARANPIKYGDKSKKVGEVRPTYMVAIPIASLLKLVEEAKANNGLVARYTNAMNYHHGMNGCGRDMGMVATMLGDGKGSGRGKALAAARNEAAVQAGRASESEQRAVAAENARIKAEQDSINGMVGMLGMMNAETRDMCLAGMTPHIRQAVMAAMANGSTLGTPAITAAQ